MDDNLLPNPCNSGMNDEETAEPISSSENDSSFENDPISVVGGLNDDFDKVEILICIYDFRSGK
jgi:hypothetical protein